MKQWIQRLKTESGDRISGKLPSRVNFPFPKLSGERMQQRVNAAFPKNSFRPTK